MFNYVAIGTHKKEAEKLNKNVNIYAEKQSCLKDIIMVQKRIASMIEPDVESIKNFLEDNPWYYRFTSYVSKLAET